MPPADLTLLLALATAQEGWTVTLAGSGSLPPLALFSHKCLSGWKEVDAENICCGSRTTSDYNVVGHFFLLSFFSKFCMWRQQLSKGKLRGLSVLVRAHWARLITQSLPGWRFGVRQTSQKALGYGEDWLEHQALPKCELSRQQSDEVASSRCFLPAPTFLQSPASSSHFTLHFWGGCTSVSSLWQLLPSAGGKGSLGGNQPSCRPSPVHGWCVI